MNDHSLSCEFYHSIYTVLFYFVCVCGWEGGRGGGGGGGGGGFRIPIFLFVKFYSVNSCLLF